VHTITKTHYGFHVVVEGFMSESEAKEFLDESERLLGTVTEGGFGMVLDQRRAKPASEEATKIIEQVMDLYAGKGLQRVAMITPNSLAKAQIDRLAKAKGHYDMQRAFDPEAPDVENRALAWARDGIDG
jgi:hypothetical protein